MHRPDAANGYFYPGQADEPDRDQWPVRRCGRMRSVLGSRDLGCEYASEDQEEQEQAAGQQCGER